MDSREMSRLKVKEYWFKNLCLKIRYPLNEGPLNFQFWCNTWIQKVMVKVHGRNNNLEKNPSTNAFYAPFIRESGEYSFWSVCLSVKTLILVIIFEWLVIELLHFACVILVARPFFSYQNVWPCHLQLRVWLTFEKL